jgi:polyisoprenoid-binding protein YceI
MTLKNRIIAFATAAAIAVPAIAVAKHSMKAGKDKVPMAFFNAKLNAGGDIEGKTADVTLDDDDDKIKVKVDLGRINTGMDLRNEHFQTKFLKGKTKAVLTVKKADIKGKKKGEVTAKLKLNDQEKDVKVAFEKDKDGDILKVKGTTTIKYTDFGWEKMCYLGVCVQEEVKVKAVLFVSKEPDDDK